MHRSETHRVDLTGGAITCVVRRRKNQKYINLRISMDGELLVSAPFGVALGRITESIRKKEQWIQSNLLKVAAGRSQHDPLRTVQLNGLPFTVTVIPDPTKRRSIHLHPDRQSIEIRTNDPSRAHVLTLLQRRLEREAKHYFSLRTAELSAQTGIAYTKLFIRNQRTRWGSSSGKGNLSVNWRAIMLPPEVQDYLIIHELAHQIHLNHSKAFWAVVEHHCPDYRTANRWLRDNALLIALFR